jgi:drug/metabolite transporter (DMT)-like permease
MLGGLAIALAAAACYETGYVMQALEARRSDPRRALRASLLGRLARRRLWVAGTALSLAGAALQAVALLFAPLTLVQPTLALGLVALLVLGRRVLHEPVGAREAAAVVAIVAGVIVVALSAPERNPHGHDAVGTAIVLGVLALVVAVPYVVARREPRAAVAGAAAGDALAALALKLLSDAADAARWLTAAAWGAVAGVTGLLALTAEMTALQRVPATRVAPVVVAAQVIVPVLVAPVTAGEDWSAAALGGALLAAAGAAVLGASAPVSGLMHPEHDGARAR